jgi:hypothetical protein
VNIDREAAVLLRRLLEEVDAGRLVASSAQGARLRRRIEGAATALDLSAKKKRLRTRA